MPEFENFGDSLLLRDRVYQAIKKEIMLGNLSPGERLNILDLANKMNISCAPVREALNMLSKDGLVELSPHRRPMVASGSKEDYLVAWELRRMLEPYAARYSINIIPQKKIDEVRVQLERLLKSPTDLIAYTEADMAVHELLHIYSGSKILSSTLTAVKTYSMRFRYMFSNEHLNDPRALKEHIEQSTREHLGILDALSARDGDLAFRTVLQHIDNYAVRNRPYK